MLLLYAPFTENQGRKLAPFTIPVNVSDRENGSEDAALPNPGLCADAEQTSVNAPKNSFGFRGNLNIYPS